MTDIEQREPVAWRVRDFGDGWILIHTEEPAQEYAKKTGAYLEPLYTGQQLAEVEKDRDYWKTEAQGETAKVQWRDKRMAELEVQIERERQDTLDAVRLRNAYKDERDHAEAEAERLRALVEEAAKMLDALIPIAEAHEDEGPLFEMWQTDKLQATVEAACALRDRLGVEG